MNEDEWRDLREGLYGTDPISAANSAQRLDREATANDLQRLRELLSGGDAFVREAAAWPISRIVGAPAMRELLVAYQRGFDEGDDNDGFSTALIELATADPSGCREALLALAEADIASVRENAVWLLQFCEPGSILR
jgi:hypothetical protein